MFASKAKITNQERLRQSFVLKALPEEKSSNQSPLLMSHDGLSGTKLVGENVPSAQSAIIHLHQTLGNRAVGRMVQAKLNISQPDDEYEREADRVAEQVMRMEEGSEVRDQKSEVRRDDESILTRLASRSSCPSCEEEEMIQPKLRITPLLQRQDEEDEEETIQTKEIGGRTSEVTSSIESRINALQGAGQPLPESTRAFFEPRFGYDFSQVRVHNSISAANTAMTLNARAFTIDHNIIFGSNQYSSETNEGKRLIAHELMHVIQQNHIIGLLNKKDNITRKEKVASEISIHEPYEVEMELLEEALTWDGSSKLSIGGVFIDAKQGQVWIDDKGQRRLIIHILGSGVVIFVKNNKPYVQTPVGFRADVGIGAIAAEVTKRTKGLVTIIEIEVAFFKGLFSAISLPAFLLITGIDIFQFVMENKKNFPKWKKAMLGLIQARKVLKAHAPTLYDIVFYTVLGEFSKRLPDVIEAKDYAKLIGILVGSLSKKLIAGSLSIINVLLKILEKVTILIAKEFPQTIPKTGSEYKQNILLLINNLKELGVKITPEIAQKIVDEYKANPLKIKNAFNYLFESLEIFKSTSVRD